MKDHRVTIQIVTHNNSVTIVPCIQSIKRQRYKSFRLLVIDSGSTDTTAARLKRLGINPIITGKNIGYAAGHNLGFAEDSSEYVLTLNPDVVLAPDFLTVLVRVMDRADTNIGSLQATLLRIDRMHERTDVIDSAGLYMTPIRRQRLRYEHMESKKIPLDVREIFGPDGAAAFYRRAMLSDVDTGFGVFDEDFFMHKEDVDLSWRAQLFGWKSLFVPTAYAYHIRSFRAGNRSLASPFLQRISLRNRYYLMVKNETPILFLRDLFWITLYDAGIFFYTLMKEPSSLSAYGMVIRELPVLLAKRRTIHNSRRISESTLSKWFRWVPA